MGERLYVRLEEDAVNGPESGTPAGTLEAYPVAPRLRGAVGQILAYRERVPDGTAIVERVLPDGAVRLVFSLAGPDPTVTVLGASTAPALVRLEGTVEGLSLALRPGAAPAVLGVPAAELEGAAVPLADLWGDEAHALHDAIAGAASDPARVDALTDALTARWVKADRATARAVARAAALLGDDAPPPVRDVAAKLGVGERRLQQLFAGHVGLTPRAFRRLARLHACLRALRRGAPSSWAAFATDRGFYDQAHLANEIRALTGLTPTELVARSRVASGSSKTGADARGTLGA